MGIDRLEENIRNRWLETNPLKVWRMKRGHVVWVIAAALHVSGNTVNRWEQGTSSPGPLNMAALEALTGIKNLSKKWALWRWPEGDTCETDLKGKA